MTFSRTAPTGTFAPHPALCFTHTFASHHSCPATAPGREALLASYPNLGPPQGSASSIFPAAPRLPNDALGPEQFVSIESILMGWQVHNSLSKMKVVGQRTDCKKYIPTTETSGHSGHSPLARKKKDRPTSNLYPAVWTA